jgi:hypothetical protein
VVVFVLPAIFKVESHGRNKEFTSAFLPFSPLAIPGYAYLLSEPTENFNQANSSPVTITELSMQNSSGSSATDTEKVAPSGDAAVSSLDQQSTHATQF